MEKECSKIKKMLEELFELQSDHIESFTKESAPDIKQQSLERENRFHNLKQTMNPFIKTVQKNNSAEIESTLLDFNKKIAGLLEQNRVLESKVKQYKERIRKNMEHISKGKIAIGSYASSAEILNNPKVISVTK